MEPRSLIRRVSVIVLAVSAAAWAQTARPGGNPLQALEPLVGGTWVAGGAAPGGATYSVTRTCRWTLPGKLLEVHDLTRAGDKQTEHLAFVGPDPETGKIVSWGFSSDGLHTRLPLAASPAPHTWVFEHTAQPRSLRVTWQMKGPDVFEEVSERRKDGPWQHAATLHFTRKESGSDGNTTAPGTAPAPGPAPSASGQADETVRALEMLAGAWTHTAEFGGQRFTSELVFRWTLGGKFLRGEHSDVEKGGAKLVTVSILGFDPQEKRLVYFGFRADGPVLAGSVSTTTDAVIFEGEVFDPRRQAQRLRVTYTRPDAETLLVATEHYRNGLFLPSHHQKMRRKK